LKDLVECKAIGENAVEQGGGIDVIARKMGGLSPSRDSGRRLLRFQKKNETNKEKTIQTLRNVEKNKKRRGEEYAVQTADLRQERQERGKKTRLARQRKGGRSGEPQRFFFH